MRIYGVTDESNDNTENTTALVANILSKVDKEFKQEELERAHRIGDPRDKKRQIIVRLKSPAIKRRILKNAKYLKNHPTLANVHLNEDLTKSRSKLAFECRKLVREKKISQTWTIEGKIHLKDNHGKLHSITNEMEFEKVLTSLNIAWPEYLQVNKFDTATAVPTFSQIVSGLNIIP